MLTLPIPQDTITIKRESAQQNTLHVAKSHITYDHTLSKDI